MKPHASVFLAGISYLLIPAVQQGLGAVRRAILHLRNRLDCLALTLAGRLAGGA